VLLITIELTVGIIPHQRFRVEISHPGRGRGSRRIRSRIFPWLVVVVVVAQEAMGLPSEKTMQIVFLLWTIFHVVEFRSESFSLPEGIFLFPPPLPRRTPPIYLSRMFDIVETGTTIFRRGGFFGLGLVWLPDLPRQRPKRFITLEGKIAPIPPRVDTVHDDGICNAASRLRWRESPHEG